MEIKEFIEKFAEAIEIEEVESLTADTVFKNLDEWSSMSTMILIGFFDEEYGKEISQSEIRACITLQDLFNLATA